MITYETIKNDKTIKTYIERADDVMKAIGYTEHSFAHVTRVAKTAGDILLSLGYDERTVELTRIAGYMHDIGNVVNRVDHSQSGALIAFRLLDKLGMDPDEICLIVSAIGNHDEGYGEPVSPMAAALILADKSDVRRSRVRSARADSSDIHDAVNYSVTSSRLSFCGEEKTICLDLEIDTSVATVFDFFEIFTTRMMLCRKAAKTLGAEFRLTANGQRLI